MRTLIGQIQQLGTVRIVYFEGGEPFLFYPLLLEGLRMVREAGFDAGIVTNGYWANSVEDGLHWLRPIRDLGIVDLGVSDDQFHRSDKNDRKAEFAREAAQRLGIPAGTICIEPPTVSRQALEAARSKPVVGGAVLFKGRAAEKLTCGLPMRPCEEFTTCPHEELASPDRVHVDAYGNVHLCQGLSIGNIWQKPLPELFGVWDAQQHPIVGPLLRGGPTRLAAEYGLETGDGYVDECHLCYAMRKLLLMRFPQYLLPKEAYGL